MELSNTSLLYRSRRHGVWAQNELMGVPVRYRSHELGKPGRPVKRPSTVDVTHPKFGRGSVVDTRFRGSDPKLVVEFASVGRKTLLARFCRNLGGYPIALRCPEPLCVADVPLPSLAPLYPDGSFGVTFTSLPARLVGPTWRALSERAPDTKIWPVLLAEGGAVEPPDPDPREAIDRSRSLGLEDLLYEDGDPDLAEELFDRADPLEGDPAWFRPVPPVGPWHSLALIQVDVAWKSIAYLPAFDGPSAAERAAFLRFYSARYRPRVYRYGSEGLELWIERPPRAWDEARDLAEQHLRFCPRLLDDDRLSLEKYTAHLLEARRWTLLW
ncbi:MAG: DUF4253 domain-containing protein [Myxococcota bacterium]